MRGDDQIALKAISVSARYGVCEVLKGVSLDVRAGEIVSLMGPNGAGKSTLIRLISGVEKPATGEVLLYGENLAEIDRREAAKKIAVVHQRSSFPFPVRCVDAVLMGRWPYMPPFGFESKKDVTAAILAMKACDCEGFASRDINSLSGGERQRVLMARALAQDPSVLLLDEPTAFLDLGHVARLKDLILRLAFEKSMAIVCAAHDPSFVAALGGRVMFLKDGRTVAEGVVKDALHPGNIKETFGVEYFCRFNGSD